MPRFELHGAWLVELRDGEDRVLLTAADRGHRMWALSWIASVRAAALATEARYEVRHTRAGGSYFVLVDEWDEVFATSRLFSNEEECRRALYYALHTIPTAPVCESVTQPQCAANGDVVELHSDPAREIEVA